MKLACFIAALLLCSGCQPKVVSAAPTPKPWILLPRGVTTVAVAPVRIMAYKYGLNASFYCYDSAHPAKGDAVNGPIVVAWSGTDTDGYIVTTYMGWQPLMTDGLVCNVEHGKVWVLVER